MGWTSATDDAELVRAYLSGSRAALGAIYDRYADALHDTATAMLGDRDDAADVTHDVFVLAAERLGQLRDPAALRAWLFAVLRHEIYGRSRRRRRTRPVDPELLMADRPAPADPAADGAGVALVELAADVRAAAGGLDQRDQLVLELTARQGLGGDELAAVLGVSVAQSYVIVSRMRDRVARSLDALALARTGRRECAELDRLLAGWDGELTVLVRKRVARHLEACATCAATHRRLGAIALVGLAPVLPAPAALRRRVLDTAGRPGDTRRPRWRDDGFPPARGASSVRRLLAAAAAAVVVALVVGGVALSRGGGTGDDVATASEVPGGATSVVRSTAPQVVAPTAPPTEVATTPATTAAGALDDPAVSPPPDPGTTTTTPATTTTITTATTTGPGSSVEPVLVAPAAPDGEPPRVTPAASASTAPCPPDPPPEVRAAVADASPIGAVDLSWTGPGAPGATPMVFDAADGRWVGRLAVDAVAGPWTFVVTATDAAGNTGTANGTLVVVGC